MGVVKIVRLRTGQQAWCFDCSSRVRLELMRNRKGRLQEKAVRVNNKIKDGYRVWLDCAFGGVVSLLLGTVTGEGLKRRGVDS